MNAWYLYGSLAVIVGSLVALSGFIIARKPEAKALFEKIAPYQGYLGVSLLGYGIWQTLANMGDFGDWFGKHNPHKIFAIGWLAYLFSAIILGFCLGFGVIANWIPGEGAAEKKGIVIQKTLLTFSLPIGIIGLVGGIITLYSYFTFPWK
jgi:hypothetical protein